MKKVLTLCCIVLMLIPSLALADTARTETGFSSPEAAVTAYIEALLQNDVPGMLSTFAVESYVDNVDTRAYCEKRSCNPISVYAAIPVGNAYIRDLLIAQRESELTKNLYMQYAMYSWYLDGAKEEYRPGNNVSFLNGDVSIDEYLQAYSGNGYPEMLQEMRLVDFLDPGTFVFEDFDIFVSENYIEQAKKAAKYCNAEDVSYVLALLETDDGDEYLQCMDCVKYGGKWYNLNQAGSLSAFLNLSPYMGGLMPYEKDAYGAMIGY